MSRHNGKRMTRRHLLAGALSMLPAKTNSTALLADPVYKEHDTGPGHPERPERFDAITQALKRAGLTESLTKIDLRVATEDEIAACHTREYIAIAKREISSGARELSTGDTRISHRSWDVALRAAGAVLNG